MKQEYCLLCFQDIEEELCFTDWLRQDALLCGNCQRQLEPLDIRTRIDGLPVRILYKYNDFLENMLYRYKENRDIALRYVFFHTHIKEINDKYRHWQIIIMPSSVEKIQERGFHHLKEMLRLCKVSIADPFIKKGNRKQSMQCPKERLKISQYISLEEAFHANGKSLLLIDDVLTTGSTIKHAYHLLRAHTSKIEALVLCAHPLFVEFCDKN